MIECETQEEIDYYLEKLSAVPEAEQYGWAQDKYSLTWQITPKALSDMLKNGSEKQRRRVFEAFIPMRKLTIFDLQKHTKVDN